jgi:hypothetical protein
MCDVCCVVVCLLYSFSPPHCRPATSGVFTPLYPFLHLTIIVIYYFVFKIVYFVTRAKKSSILPHSFIVWLPTSFSLVPLMLYAETVGVLSVLLNGVC